MTRSNTEEQLFHVYTKGILNEKNLSHNNRVGGRKRTENIRKKGIWPVQPVLTNDLMPPTKQL